jgi:signal transduction histidine kinase
MLAQPEGSSPVSDEVDLGRWLKDQVGRWSLHPRAADLHCDIGEGEPWIVRVNPQLLAQLLDNLIENAWKYSEPGTPVVVELGRQDGQIVLSVSDRGRGLDADELTRVFEPFFRGEDVRRDGIGGVGLGLAIAQRIARGSGGTLDVVSERGVGSRFVLRLPEITCEQREPIGQFSTV